MKKIKGTGLLLITLGVLLTVVFSSCSSSRTAQCGCPSKKSMVGY